MTSFFSKPKVPAPPAVPTIDDTAQNQNAADRLLRRGRATTILTSDKGLPDLGTTVRPAAGGY